VTRIELWSDEIEAMRAEARDAVASGIAVVREFLGDRGDAFLGDGRDGSTPRDERVRIARDAMARVYTPVPEAQERKIAGIPCRVFLPDGDAVGVYLHCHGGGMVTGQPVMNDLGNRAIARQFGLAVVSVDYRLAPEHPYPAGIDDGTEVAAWVLEHATSEFGANANRLLVGGESAGGYLAAALTLRVRDDLGAPDRIDGVNLVFGVYDWGRSPSQRGIRPHRGPDLLDPDGITFFTECYLPGRTDDERRDPRVSPLFADLHDLPPALMSVGTTDHLVDDTLMLANRWAAAGNEVDLFVAPDLPHGFMAFPCGLTTAWIDHTNAWFAEVLSRPARAAAAAT